MGGWILYQSLSSGARKALKRGSGIYRRYAVSKGGSTTYIAGVNLQDPKRWYAVIHGVGKVIKEKTA